MQPLLIIGTQRSGSNMLRLMLNQLPEIAAPHPPHILSVFFPLLPGYGNLETEENFMLLVTDVCRFVKANPVPWRLNMLTPAQIRSRCHHSSLVEVFKAVYEIYTQHHDAQIWCCKSMANLYYIAQIEQQGLHPIYIHLVRDGRDVAVSFRKIIVGEKHIYHLAKQWQTDQQTAHNLCQQYAPGRYILIHYENLIHDTENTLRLLLHRLGLNFNPAMLQFYKTPDALETAAAGKMWNNVRKPVIEKNSNKFLGSLSDEEILIFESIAGQTLAQFGYQPYFAESKWLKGFTAAQIAGFDTLNAALKKQAQQTLDPAGSEKRKEQEAVIAAIKSRSPASF
ncbi:MAG TPA: sulfotransferase [Chitinophagales bacterium]|nr:sulfotransferase [Chitinophagales bacterium]